MQHHDVTAAGLKHTLALGLARRFPDCPNLRRPAISEIGTKPTFMSNIGNRALNFTPPCAWLKATETSSFWKWAEALHRD